MATRRILSRRRNFNIINSPGFVVRRLRAGVSCLAARCASFCSSRAMRLAARSTSSRRRVTSPANSSTASLAHQQRVLFDEIFGQVFGRPCAVRRARVRERGCGRRRRCGWRRSARSGARGRARLPSAGPCDSCEMVLANSASPSIFTYENARSRFCGDQRQVGQLDADGDVGRLVRAAGLDHAVARDAHAQRRCRRRRSALPCRRAAQRVARPGFLRQQVVDGRDDRGHQRGLVGWSSKSPCFRTPEKQKPPGVSGRP